MTIPQYNFINYLAAKKTVDDRALNRPVLDSLVTALPATTPEKPLRVLEVACGSGTMLERLLEWQILPQATYTAIDKSVTCIETAVARLPQWAVDQGFQVTQTAPTQFHLLRNGQQLTVQFEAIDADRFTEREQPNQPWDLLIAHAFWDLVDIAVLLPQLLRLLTSQGLYYFSINFDGETILLPTIHPQLDKEIINHYHQAMDNQHVQNQAKAGTQTGRYLFHHLTTTNTTIINAGSSDWVVFPTNGSYLHQEAYFLHCIIHSIETMLQPHLTPDRQAWLKQRHAQIEQGELIYIAHQLDFVGRKQNLI